MKIKWGDVAKKLNSQTNSSIFRSGKLCRERWNNYLNPDIKKYDQFQLSSYNLYCFIDVNGAVMRMDF